MGFRKEVRVFIQDMRMMSKALRDFIKVQSIEKRALEKILDRQEKEIQDLRDRLAARDLPEYKTFKLQEEGFPVGRSIEDSDENMIGEVVEN